jgi:uncharacterized iron-regulated protein
MVQLNGPRVADILARWHLYKKLGIIYNFEDLDQTVVVATIKLQQLFLFFLGFSFFFSNI